MAGYYLPTPGRPLKSLTVILLVIHAVGLGVVSESMNQLEEIVTQKVSIFENQLNDCTTQSTFAAH